MFEHDNSALRVKQRQVDIRARIERSHNDTSGCSDEDFMVNLNTKIKSFRAETVSDRERAFELFRKTNQFNFTFNRLIDHNYFVNDEKFQPACGSLYSK